MLRQNVQILKVATISYLTCVKLLVSKREQEFTLRL